MSRIAKMPILIPNGVTVDLNGDSVVVKGSKGTMLFKLMSGIGIELNDNKIQVRSVVDVKKSGSYAGTVRAVLANMVRGVSHGFEKKMVMVGYRAQLVNGELNLVLGYSHPVNYKIPEGITVEVPNQTEIVVKGIDKQKVGQVASEIRAYRSPEPYKGKGVKYSEENVLRKEAKKK
jgi:large subunit ribosomal protein L6